jgi:hypothetical protein
MAKKKTDGASKNGGVASSATYFLSLSLENARCFLKKQTLDLSIGKGGPARWTILLGNNGLGKTTLLQAFALLSRLGAGSDPDSTLPIESRRREPIHTEPIHRLSSMLRNDESAAELQASVTLQPFGSPDRDAQPRFELSIQVQPSHGGTLVGTFPPRNKRAERLHVHACFGYGAGRRLGRPELAVDEDDPLGTLFSDVANLRNAEDWLLKLDYVASKPSSHQKRQEELRALVVKVLLDTLPDTEDLRFDAGQGGYPKPKIEFRTPYGWVPLRQLGYGYQTVIAWMVDLASRMVERYPDSPNPLAEPAIVLVDEIDLHLHPTWQRKLIPMLTDRFPNTQFIATAHSPLIVQAAGDANLAVLRREGDQVVIDNDVEAIRGWRIDQIYTSELFDVPSAWPPEFDEPMKRRKQLLMKGKLTAPEKKELERLDKEVMGLPGGETPEQKETMRLLREALETLKEEKAPTT